MENKKVMKKIDKIIRENPEAFGALLEFEKTGRLPTIESLKKESKNKRK